jgi:hypothetical protein
LDKEGLRAVVYFKNVNNFPITGKGTVFLSNTFLIPIIKRPIMAAVHRPLNQVIIESQKGK